MENELNKKIAIVTGVARGVGKYTAEQLLQNDIKVFGIDIRKTFISGMTFFQGDVRDEKFIIDVFNKISLKVRHVDWLINCAGVICENDIETIKNLSVREWREVIDINLTSVFIMSKYAIPFLEKSKCGNIINFSSEKVYKPDIGTSAYTVSKAGIEMLTKILAIELLTHKIRVNTIAMSSTRTDFIREYINDDIKFENMLIETSKKMPYGLIERSDIFATIWFILTNSKISGQTLLIDSGVLLL